MFFSPQKTLLVSPPLTDLSHLVNYRLRAFLLVWLHFQGILQLTSHCFKLSIQRENNLWLLTPLRANGCHPCLTFRYTVSWEPGSVCIKPASCHSILTSTIEEQGTVLQSGYTERITTAMLTAWGAHRTSTPNHLARARRSRTALSSVNFPLSGVLSLSPIPSCPFSSSFKMDKTPETHRKVWLL